MALDTKDWEGINRCLTRLYRELDSQRHPRLMLELLHELVPVDSSAVNLYKPPDELTAIEFPEHCMTAEQVALVGRYRRQSPYAAYYLATQDASWKMTSDFMPVEEFYKLDLHRIALKPLEVNYQLGGFLVSMDGTAHVITLHRTHQGFTEREREILNTLQPHLVSSYINAIVHSRAQNAAVQIQAAMATAPGAYGYFDAEGRVGWLQEKTKAWLREFFPDEVLYQQSVPQTVQQLVAASLREGRAPKQVTQVKGDETLILCLGASPAGGWIMRLERKPTTPLPHFRPLPQFSRRKNEVLQWMVEGKRNAEIARILCISSRTMEKHVSDILVFFHVENRATAILSAMTFCASINGG